MDLSTIIGIVGGLASILSVPFALYQLWVNRRLKLEQKRSVWSRIESTKSMMRALDAEDIDFTYGLAVQQYRDLLKDAVLLEQKFDLTTIIKWRKVGKISSNWQQRNVMTLLQTSEITEVDIGNEYSDYDHVHRYSKDEEMKSVTEKVEKNLKKEEVNVSS